MLQLPPIEFIDRATGGIATEKVYGEALLSLLYGDSSLAKLLSPLLRTALGRLPTLSAWYGALQRLPRSRRKIAPFIAAYELDAGEFEKQVDQFTSFDDFFTRKLKPESRPIDLSPTALTAPADGRYWCCPNVEQAESFFVKGKRFQLHDLLRDNLLAQKYAGGSMLLARLCPSDYHRFHFPCDGFAGTPRRIRGYLGSVNPASLKRNISTFVENRRMVTEVAGDVVGDFLFIEVGATCVGTIHQTFQPNSYVYKGEEKGYFSFGGSALILLFEPGRLVFDDDLAEASSKFMELRCLMGQSIGCLR